MGTFYVYRRQVLGLELNKEDPFAYVKEMPSILSEWCKRDRKNFNNSIFTGSNSSCSQTFIKAFLLAEGVLVDCRDDYQTRSFMRDLNKFSASLKSTEEKQTYGPLIRKKMISHVI